MKLSLEDGLHAIFIDEGGIMDKPLLELKKVTKIFSVGGGLGLISRRTIKAVNSVSLQMPSDKPLILALVGESDSGKSLTLKALIDMLPEGQNQSGMATGLPRVLLNKFYERSIVLDTPSSCIEVTLRAKGEDLLLHLVNYSSGLSRPLLYIIPVPINISLKGNYEVETVIGRKTEVSRRDYTKVSFILEEYGLLVLRRT